MCDLLASNWMRLRKSKLFAACLILMAVFGLLLFLGELREAHTGEQQLDDILFKFLWPAMFASAAFSSLYLGADYSDGTVRNKLLVGHSRVRVYLSNLIANLAAAYTMCFSCLFIVLAAGLPCFGAPKTGGFAVGMTVLGSFLALAVFCALFTMVGMLCTNKAGATVINLLCIVLLMLLLSSLMQARLAEPEFYNEYILSANGEMEANYVANPSYVGGMMRRFLQFMVDFLPTGQVQQYSSLDAVHLWQMPLYSLLLFAAVTVSGVLLFSRKDLN